MTIEELKDRVAAAKNAVDLASGQLREAKEALRAAIEAETGLMGHKVEFVVKNWRKPDETKAILVTGVGRWNAKAVRGRLFKKDGSVGVMQAEADIDFCRDLGLYVEPTP